MLHETGGNGPVYLTCAPAKDDDTEEDLYLGNQPTTWVRPSVRGQVQVNTGVWVGMPGDDVRLDIPGLTTFGYSAGEGYLPVIVNQTLAAIPSSGVTTAVYHLLKTWVDARNGRKLKIKVGDVEVEATQMKEEDVLRIFELLEEKADRKKIRELLLEAGRGGGEARRALSTAVAVIPGRELSPLLAKAGEKGRRRFIEFFTAKIENPNTRDAYARDVRAFSHGARRRASTSSGSCSRSTSRRIESTSKNSMRRRRSSVTFQRFASSSTGSSKATSWT